MWGGPKFFGGSQKGGPVFPVGQRGDPNFLRVKKGRGPEFHEGGPEFFCVDQGGTRIFLRMPSLPVKNDSSLIIKALPEFNIIERIAI